MNKWLILIVLAKVGWLNAQTCDTNMLIIDPVRASETDANIPFELAQHYTFFNPDCTPRNTLLVHLVGSYAAPYQSVLFPKYAANNGFHVLSLKYINDQAAQTPCGPSTDIDCHYKFRKEIIDGIDLSPETQVDSVNSIQNRLIRLLQYMVTNNPSQNWGQYFTGDSIHWGAVILSGHSQGGGHAALMAVERPVKRVLMFASPNDYSDNFSQVAGWTNLPHVTEDSAYFSFNNVNDQVAPFDWQYAASQNIGVVGDTNLVDNDQCPFGTSHNLYTAIDLPNFGSDHGSVVHDASVPVDGNGVPVFQEVWSYLLGISCLPLGLEDESFQVMIAPNPTKGSVSISSVDIVQKYRVLDARGSEILHKSIDHQEFQIDLSQLESGIYFLELCYGLKRSQHRIIVE